MKTKRIVKGFEPVAAVLIAALLVLGGCPASAGGGSDNTPQPQLVKKGDITEYNTNAKIPVYQTAGVSDSAITTDVANVIAGYNATSTSKKNPLIGKVSAIHIIPTASNGYYEYEVKNGKVILKIKTGLDLNDTKNCFSDFVDNDLAGLNLSQSPAQETVRMAFLHTRQTGRIPGPIMPSASAPARGI